jgi:hypothetical protein
VRWNDYHERKLKAEAMKKKEEESGGDDSKDEDWKKDDDGSGNSDSSEIQEPRRKKRKKEKPDTKKTKRKRESTKDKKPAKKRKTKNAASDSEEPASGSGSESSEIDLTSAKRREVSKLVEKGVVQAGLKAKRKSDKRQNETDLSESYTRIANAKIGTYVIFTWLQMVPNQVRGQRGEVVATVKGIGKKLDTNPNAPVSNVFILCPFSIINISLLLPKNNTTFIPHENM